MSEINNYITLSRKLFDNPLWKEKRDYHRAEAWIDLLQLARFEAESTSLLIGNNIVEIFRGEIPVSLRYLAERWGWSKNKVDSFLNLLITNRMITRRTAKGTTQTIITICKYDEYNYYSKNTGQRRDSTGTVPGQRRDKTNKDNKVNNRINKLILMSEPSSDDNPIYFRIAKSYHNLFLKVKGLNKTLGRSDASRWIDTVRKLIEIDKCTIAQLVGIRTYLEASHDGIPETDPFWIETIYSIDALRKKNNQGEFYFDRIRDKAKLFFSKNKEYSQKVKKECEQLLSTTEN